MKTPCAFSSDSPSTATKQSLQSQKTNCLRFPTLRYFRSLSSLPSRSPQPSQRKRPKGLPKDPFGLGFAHRILECDVASCHAFPICLSFLCPSHQGLPWPQLRWGGGGIGIAFGRSRTAFRRVYGERNRHETLRFAHQRKYPILFDREQYTIFTNQGTPGCANYLRFICASLSVRLRTALRKRA